MFGVVDGVAGNFEEEFAMAQSRHKEEKVAPDKSKDAEKKEVAKEEKAEEKPLVEEKLTEEGEKLLEVTEEKETAPTEKVEEELAPPLTEEDVIIEDAPAVKEEKIVETAKPILDEETLVEAPEKEIAEELTVVEDEVIIAEEETAITDEKIVEKLPDEKPVEEDVVIIPEKELQTTLEELPKAEAAPLAATVEKTAETKTDIPVEKPAPTEEKVAPTPIRSEAKAETPTEKATPEATPKVQEKIAPVEVKASAVKEETPSTFHDIIPEGEKGAPMELDVDIDPEEGQKVQRTLQEIALNTEVKRPDIAKLSARLLQGVEKAGPGVAKHLSNARGGQNPNPAMAANRLDAAKPFTAKEIETPVKAKTYASRFEELKGKVVDQVRVKLATTQAGNNSKISIHLKPKYLGNIKVEMSLQDNEASARFIVDNQSVKELLQSSTEELQRALEEHGIDVADVDVDVADHTAADMGENGRSFASAEDQKVAREWLSSFRRFGNEEEEIETSNIIEENNGDGIVNIVA